MSDLKREEAAASAKYLTFTSSGQDYAIPIMRMKEIVPYGTSTRVPFVPNEIRGLINLRGRAIPVVDLAVRFGGEKMEVTNRTCVLIVDLMGEQDRPDMGILADSVSRVIDLDPDEIEETPDFGVGDFPHLLSGMAKQGDSFIPIVDVEQVLQPDAALAAILPGSGAAAPAGETTEEALDSDPDAEPSPDAAPDPSPDADPDPDTEAVNAD